MEKLNTAISEQESTVTGKPFENKRRESTKIGLANSSPEL